MEFKILGPLEVRRDGEFVPVGGPKPRAVLAFLVLHANQPVSADRLAAALWGDDAAAKAVKAVRVHVSRLRKALGDPSTLTTVAGGYQLRVRPGELDLDRFQQLLDEGRRTLAGGRPEDAALLLGDALALWRGPALADLALEPFAHTEIVRLEELRLAGVELRVEAELATGRHAELIAELQGLRDEHPLRERLHAHLMIALYRSGRQADALDVYRRARALLVEQLGIEPRAELRELHEAVLRQDRALDLERREAPAERLPLTQRLREQRGLVGREEELAAIARAIAGQRVRLVLVAGEAGIGKTSVAVEAARRADAMTVLYGRCDEEPLTPYQPFAEALRDLGARSPAILERPATAPHVPELARMLPELGGAAAGEGDRHRLFEAVAGVLDEGGGPWLCVLDDLHWVDGPTLAMLRYVLRRVRTRLVILATARDTPDSGGPVAALAVDLRREEALVRLRLVGLDPEATQRLVAMRARAEPDPELARRVHARTGGNPFFIEQLVRSGPDTAVPEGVAELIAQRVGRLPEVAGETLRIAAAICGEFELGLLEQLIHDRAALVAALDAATSVGLVTEVGGSPGHFAFAHALTRDAIYHGMSATRRATLHRRIADALEQRSGIADAGLAHHLLNAGPLAPAAEVRDALVAAARAAAAALAFETAAEHLRRALELPEQIPPETEFELLLALGDAQQRAGDRETARQALQRAVTLARALADANALARAALGYGGGFDWYGFSYDTDPAVTALLEEALAAQVPDPDLQVRLLARLTLERYYAARYADASALSAKAVDNAERLPDARSRLIARYSALFPLDRPDAVPQLERAASRMLEDPDIDEELAFRVRVFRLRARLQLADLRGVDIDVEACQRAAAQLRQPLYRWQAGVLRAMRALMRGAVDEAEREALTAHATGVEAGQAAEAQYVLAPQLLTVASLRGRVLDFEAPLRAHLDAAPIMQPRVEAMLAFVLAEGGRLDEAKWWLSRCMDRDPARQPRHSLWLLMVATLAEATAILRVPTDAERLLPLLRPYADQCLVTGAGAAYVGAVSYYLGRLADVVGDSSQGDRWFSRAVDVERAMEAAPGIARAQLGWAALLVHHDGPGDRARASALAGAAVATAEELALTALAERADAVLAAARCRASLKNARRADG